LSAGKKRGGAYHNRTLSLSPYRCRDVEDDNGNLGTPVVHRSEAVVPLLSCRVPDLELHRCIVQTNCLSEERSYSGHTTSSHVTTRTTRTTTKKTKEDIWTEKCKQNY